MVRNFAGVGVLAFVTLAWIGCAGQRLRPDARPDSASVGNCHVFVLNKSSEAVVSATVFIDGKEVLTGDVPRLTERGEREEVRLRLPLGVHRVRAVVGTETTEIEVEVTSIQTCECQIILHDEPDEFAPGRYSRLSVAQIHPC